MRLDIRSDATVQYSSSPMENPRTAQPTTQRQQTEEEHKPFALREVNPPSGGIGRDHAAGAGNPPRESPFGAGARSQRTGPCTTPQRESPFGGSSQL